jgi:hypothetical protein
MAPGIAALSMVFTGRAREFCRLAQALRNSGFTEHLTAGGHFAALNCRQLMSDFAEFDSIALGEGEELICELAEHLDDISAVAGFCRRDENGNIIVTPSRGNPENLDALPFPRRDSFHEYYGRPIASILSSRGCWRSCAFCSIDAWYRSGGGQKFRVRGIPNIVAEMKELYHTHGVRIFNFQDDNFFLPDPVKALARFTELRDSLWAEGVKEIAIAVKARPDSINRDSLAVLDDLGLFRVFLGVENASERGLKNLNRKCSRKAIETALQILNDFDVHIAYNLLMFEPDTVMDDILINLRFMERHIDNPFNFCRAEAYAATGLEKSSGKTGSSLAIISASITASRTSRQRDSTKLPTMPSSTATSMTMVFTISIWKSIFPSSSCGVFTRNFSAKSSAAKFAPLSRKPISTPIAVFPVSTTWFRPSIPTIRKHLKSP